MDCLHEVWELQVPDFAIGMAVRPVGPARLTLGRATLFCERALIPTISVNKSGWKIISTGGGLIRCPGFSLWLNRLLGSTGIHPVVTGELRVHHTVGFVFLLRPLSPLRTFT